MLYAHIDTDVIQQNGSGFNNFDLLTIFFEISDTKLCHEKGKQYILFNFAFTIKLHAYIDSWSIP